MSVKHREVVVTNTISSREVIKMMLPPRGHVEVRERQNGTWLVFYPDPGFIPCSPNCSFGQRGQPLPNHKHEYEPSFIQSTYTPDSYADALDWAHKHAAGREVKVVPYLSQAERRAAKKD